jgi:ATP-dependent Clp protease ATP-binding subunit ClpC
MMFQKFTDQARRAVALGQKEGQMRHSARIGTEHLLLGLIVTGEIAVLESLGISPEDVCKEIVEIIGPARGTAPYQIPFTVGARRALELSAEEADRLGQDHVGPEYLLLALIREGEETAAQVLVGRGASLARAREQVARLT